MKKILYFVLLYCAYIQAQDLHFQWPANQQEDVPYNLQLPHYNEIYPENNPITPEDHSTPIDFYFSECLSQFSEKLTIGSDYDHANSRDLDDSFNSIANQSDYYDDIDKENIMPSSPHNYEENKSDISCSECGCDGFSNIKKLNAHIAKIHTESIEKKYKCDQCRSYFTRSNRLQMHMLDTHTPKQNGMFKCVHCPALVKTSFHYLQHLEIHKETSKKNYKCSLCPSYFSSESSRYEHKKKIHTLQQSLQ